MAEQARTAAPGAYWREVLADAVQAHGSWWTVGDLLLAVGECNANLVDVAGWLCDELAMGRMQPVDTWPRLYERVPGSPIAPTHPRR